MVKVLLDRLELAITQLLEQLKFVLEFTKNHFFRTDGKEIRFVLKIEQSSQTDSLGTDNVSFEIMRNSVFLQALCKIDRPHADDVVAGPHHLVAYCPIV